MYIRFRFWSRINKSNLDYKIKYNAYFEKLINTNNKLTEHQNRFFQIQNQQVYLYILPDAYILRT